MKKISLFVVILLVTLMTTSCSKGGPFGPAMLDYNQAPTLLGVSSDYAVATISYAGQQIQVQTTYSPFFDGYGNILRLGRNGQGIMTIPPIKPQSWEQDYGTGRWIANGFTYCEGMNAEYGSCFIVRGNWTPDGSQLQFALVRVSGKWRQTPNPYSYISLYAPNTYYPQAGWYSYVQVYLDRYGYILGS